MKPWTLTMVILISLFGCRQAGQKALLTQTSIVISGHHIRTSLSSLNESKLTLTVTLSNSSTTHLIQDQARGDPFPPNIVRVFFKSSGIETELLRSQEGTNAYLQGELWVSGHYTSRPVILTNGQSATWNYPLDKLFMGINRGTYRVEFVPSAINGFGDTNYPYVYRKDLSSSNLCITIR